MRASIDTMLRTIDRHFAETQDETGLDRMSRVVREAMARVPRDRFLPADERMNAWQDSPLPIGHGQTISQPFIVALMTQLLDPGPGKRILEVGCGCGYQSAVLAETGAEVFGVEIVTPLAEQAGRTLAELGYSRVSVRAGDGWHGWVEHAPFDGIVVTAAAREVPEPLKMQLRVYGRLVLPLEAANGMQRLELIERSGERSFASRPVLDVRFVPFTRA